MKRFDARTMALLSLPALGLLIFCLSSTWKGFQTRPAFRIIRNELLPQTNGKARHNVEYEVRSGSWFERQIRREAVVNFQTYDSSCVDSTGKIFRDLGGGSLDTTQGLEHSYAIYSLHNLQKSSGDLKLTMILSYIEGGVARKLPVKLTIPRSKLPK